MKNNEKLTNDGLSLESMLTKGEEILWRGAPQKKAFFFAPIVNNLLSSIVGVIISIALLFFTLGELISGATFDGSSAEIVKTMIIVLALLMLVVVVPVWLIRLYIKARRHKNIDYALTNRRIIIKNGLIGIDYKSINYKEIKNVKLDVKWHDKLFNVGDVYILTDDKVYPSKSKKFISDMAFYDIEDCYEVYKKIQKIIVDIQTDIEHPNALRPEENPGYKSKDGKK